MNRGDLMANIRRGITFYKITAAYACVMLTLILIALVSGWTIE